MQKQRSLKCLSRSFLAMLCTLLLISLFTIIILSTRTTKISKISILLPYSIHTQVSDLQIQLGVLLKQLHDENSDSKALAKFSDQILHIAVSLDKLAENLRSLSNNAPTSDDDDQMSKIDEDFSEPEESEENQEERPIGVKVFNSVGKRGFFKCADCFNLSKRGWEIPTNESISAEFTIDEVLGLKTGEIRIGLDFSPTTGTFAALMRERNVTVTTATLNLGAPFNEVIALRGLLPLYLSIGSRLPFFDNTLDIIHSTLFLDGWIGIELLQFVLFDWDRVLRPKGILWVDRFFCKKDDMKLYLDEFTRLGYKKLLWRVVPKTDKLEDELFFSGVLEKPIRRQNL
ncbi:hypothetical protein JCGZ_25580 [Jatropha curcas]|uniref:Methyltransferase type 11 domain-containing protein n=1 Tax=Jatropha curcas TaxID=180498 RepID=A0A067JXM6_JATCU|nr:hypothetical protein JCGZ_25580 [Jatropha curcas]